jgi:hypothetical protein
MARRPLHPPYEGHEDVRIAELIDSNGVLYSDVAIVRSGTAVEARLPRAAGAAPTGLTLTVTDRNRCDRVQLRPAPLGDADLTWRHDLRLVPSAGRAAQMASLFGSFVDDLDPVWVDGALEACLMLGLNDVKESAFRETAQKPATSRGAQFRGAARLRVDMPQRAVLGCLVFADALHVRELIRSQDDSVIASEWWASNADGSPMLQLPGSGNHFDGWRERVFVGLKSPAGGTVRFWRTPDECGELTLPA